MTKLVFTLALAWCLALTGVIIFRLLWGAMQLGWFIGKAVLDHRARKQRNWIRTYERFSLSQARYEEAKRVHKESLPKKTQPWRPARRGEGYAAAPYDGRPLPKVASGPAAGGYPSGRTPADEIVAPAAALRPHPTSPRPGPQRGTLESWIEPPSGPAPGSSVTYFPSDGLPYLMISGSTADLAMREDLERHFRNPDGSYRYHQMILSPGAQFVAQEEAVMQYEDKAETAGWEASKQQRFPVSMAGIAMETTGGWRNGVKSFPWGPPRELDPDDFSQPGTCRSHNGEAWLNKGWQCFECAELDRLKVTNEWADSACHHKKRTKKRDCQECLAHPWPSHPGEVVSR